MIKPVLQELMVTVINNINKDGEGNNSIVGYFWHYFSRDLHLAARSLALSNTDIIQIIPQSMGISLFLKMCSDKLSYEVD